MKVGDEMDNKTHCFPSLTGCLLDRLEFLHGHHRENNYTHTHTGWTPSPHLKQRSAPRQAKPKAELLLSGWGLAISHMLLYRSRTVLLIQHGFEVEVNLQSSETKVKSFKHSVSWQNHGTMHRSLWWLCSIYTFKHHCLFFRSSAYHAVWAQVDNSSRQRCASFFLFSSSSISFFSTYAIVLWYNETNILERPCSSVVHLSSK